jgi:tetratricopeptide (TPR) repeat protein
MSHSLTQRPAGLEWPGRSRFRLPERRGIAAAPARGPRYLLFRFCLVWAGFAAALAAAQATAQHASMLSAEERSKLDTFEGITLDKADKVFGEKDYPRALAEYDAFILQFPESKATSYAILRKGRSLQLLDKRFEAIKIYQEVLDFFPNDIKYAAPALYLIGECHDQNGDVEKAMKSWLALADDPDYCKEPVGAAALNQLAGNYIKQGKVDEGIKRYEQVAVDFRKANPDSARHAIGMVVPHHVRTKPDVKPLRAFYEAVRTFEHNPQTPGPDAATDAVFWRQVRAAVKANNTFTEVQKAERENYFRYWCGQMQGKFPADDDFQIDLAAFLRAADGDDAAWEQRLDKQFADHQKPGDFARIIRWIGLYAARKQKADEYYQKLDFAKMTNADILALTYTLLDNGGEPGLARNTFDKMRWADLNDDAKLSICDAMRNRQQLPGSREMALQACLACNDQNKGRMHALRYLHWRCIHARAPADIPDGLKLAAELQPVPECAKEAFSIGGNLLQWSGKFEEAIKAYRSADSPPQTLFWTAECLAKLGKLEPAVAQLREIENFFPPEASRAGLGVAYLYRDAGIKEKYVRSLRGVLKKYPKSGQSSEAHQRLEEMGLPIGGGVEADE